MPNRSVDRLRQSLRDLDQAVDSAQAGRHERTCFAAHQATERAVNALRLSHRQEMWGHVIGRLLRRLPEAASPADSLVEPGQALDNFFIPSRYPQGHPEGAPLEHYGPLVSQEVICHDRTIVDFVRDQLARRWAGPRRCTPPGAGGRGAPSGRDAHRPFRFVRPGRLGCGRRCRPADHRHGIRRALRPAVARL